MQAKKVTTKKATEPKKEETEKSSVADTSNKGQIISILKRTGVDGIEDLISYLENSDFFIAPASTQYHGAYVGGLAQHCLNVLDALLSLYEFYKTTYDIADISEKSMIIVALLHDVCKINCYKEDFRNVKNEKGVWEKIPCYKKDPLLSMGHAGKSIFIIQKFISLSAEEAQAIFWHMGAYDISNYNTLNELGQSYTENTLAFLLNQADMTSTYIIENPSA